MGIKQVYTIGGNVCTLGGYAMGPTALPDPKPKTLVISTDNASCTASASAYVNGSFVTSWTARNGSASASAMVGPGQDVVVVTETNRPLGYSSTIYSTGYTTSSPSYYAGYATVSGTATFDGDDTAIMSAKYSAAKMIVSGTGFFDCDITNPTTAGAFPYTTPLMLHNSASSWPAANLAYKYMSGETGWSHLYSSNMTKLVLSSFSALRLTANANISAKQSTGSNSRIYARLYNGSVNIGAKNIYDTVNEYVTLAGTAQTGGGTSVYPMYNVVSHDSASAYVYNETWSFSGVLK